MSNNEDRLDSGGLLYVFQRLKTILTGMFPARESVIDISEKGTANGVAELDGSGKVPASQLPSFVDDVVEYASLADFPETGESGKIYVALDTNKTYRWGGSEYVVIASDLALGETETTAYRGDRGKAAYDHSQAKGTAHVNGFYKVTTNSEGHVTEAFAVAKADITALGIPGQDTTYEPATEYADGLMSSTDKVRLDEMVTGITMNGSAKAKDAQGVVDLGTVLTQHQDISGKADKISGGVNGNFVSLDSNGNIADSGHKHSDYITDVSGKADKVSNATSGNFASLDGNGNLTDSGHKHSDYLTEHQDISGKIDVSEKGAANGVAELDNDGKVPSAQLPSYVDDVVEYPSLSQFPATGESGKIYVALDTNKTYRWSGTTYVAISSDLALGETSSTAYRGDRGKIAYDHATDHGRLTTAQASGLYKIATTQEGHVASVTPVAKSDITALGIPGQDTTYSDMTGAGTGSAGVHGLVPAPAAGDNVKFLRGDGTWAEAGGGSTAFAEYDISIAVSAWTGSAPYTYTWTSVAVTSNCLVDVYFHDGTRASLISDISYTKVTGGVQFTVSDLPTGTLPLTIRVISNTEALILPDMEGATGSVAGAHGLVPAPAAGDNEKFLKGDGTWSDVEALPAVTASDNGKFLTVVNGAWAATAMAAWQGGSF